MNLLPDEVALILGKATAIALVAWLFGTLAVRFGLFDSVRTVLGI